MSSDESIRESDDSPEKKPSTSLRPLDLLRERLQHQGEPLAEPDEFFKKYYLTYCGKLPSQAVNRLSQFTEEDSDEARPSSSEGASSPDQRYAFLMSQVSDLPGTTQTIHFGTDGVDIQHPNVRDAFVSGYLRHFDKRFFDSSLREIRGHDLEAGTSSDDVWLERQTKNDEKVLAEVAKNMSEMEVAQKEEEEHFQKTIHGTSVSSRKPSLLNIFRHKEKNEKKSIVHQIKTAFQGRSNSLKDASVHLDVGSQKNYYHTVTPSTKRSSAITKVMDIFQRRPSTQIEPSTAQQRRETAIKQHKTMVAAHQRLRRKFSEDITASPPPKSRFTQRASSFDSSRPLLSPPRDPRMNTNQMFIMFYEFHKCYEIMPTSAKLVTMDVKLKLKDTLRGLLINRIRAAPLWDSTEHEFPGIITITDFIKILRHYNNTTIEDISEETIAQWRETLKESLVPLITIGPDDSLYKAIQLLLEFKLHRLPIIDPNTGNIVGIITLRHLLKFMLQRTTRFSKPDYCHSSLKICNIGTAKNIETITENTPIIDVLTKFIDRRVSSMPILDLEGKIIDMCAKSDAMNLCSANKYKDLDQPWKTVMVTRNEWYEGVKKCTLGDEFYDVLQRMSNEDAHRMVITDDQDKVIAMLSLSDVMRYLIMGPQDE